MDRVGAIGLLPEAHATALRLLNDGRGDEIAARLAIPPEGVALLLRVAAGKLDELLSLP